MRLARCGLGIAHAGAHSQNRIYQASTSELYGMVQGSQRVHPLLLRSPYGVAKLYAYWITVNYRESTTCMPATASCLTMKARRGETFVTRKITRGWRASTLASTAACSGNLDSLRDWGHARDYVEMQWRMLQQEGPERLRDRNRAAGISAAFHRTRSDLGWVARTERQPSIGRSRSSRDRSPPRHRCCGGAN